MPSAEEGRSSIAVIDRETRRVTSKMWIERLIRYSKPCTEYEFNWKLYEVLWVRAEGYDSVAVIADQLYKKHEICAIHYARQNGFDTFEQMLHSEELKQVVTIERICSTFKPNYKSYHYRAALHNRNPMFSSIRKRLTQQKMRYTNPMFQELNRRMAGLPTEAEMQWRRRAECTVKKERKFKEIHGDIFSYEVEIGSGDDEVAPGEEEEENGMLDGEYAFADEDGDEWTEEAGQDEDGDLSTGSSLENVSAMGKKPTAKHKGKWLNAKKAAC